VRYISAAFQEVLDSRRRRPAYKIYAWDPRGTTISQVASAPGNLHAGLPTPLDITPYASEIAWSDKQLSFTMVDPNNLFHPDSGAYRNYLGDGAILRLVEGDEILSETDWVTSFTGQIHGQVGWKKARHTGSVTAKVSVFGRAETQAFKRRKITTREYSVGTDLGIALYDVCETFMGLTKAEVRIPFTLGRQFKHKVNQLAQVSPWEAITSLLEVVCYQPYFDGEGKLTYVNKSFQRPPAKVLADYIRCVELEVPENSQDGINKVKVVFLDAQLERVDGPYQKLGDAQVTTGFFSMHETLPCWWSEDHKQRADGTSMKVIKSVNSGLLPVGNESYEQKDDFHGEIEVEISVWVPILATVMALEYVAAALIPDETTSTSKGFTLPTVLSAPGAVALVAPPTGGPVTGVITMAPIQVVAEEVPGTGFTIPWGRVLQAQAMLGIMLIQMSIGSAQYEVWGTPYDYAYLEKMSIAMEDGLDYWLENEKEIKNDFVGSHDQADTIAVTELIWEKSLTRPRRVVIENDPSLEVGDIIVIPDGRKILITGLSKKIKRGEVASLVMDGCKVMTP
jgi:hypothetical protein